MRLMNRTWSTVKTAPSRSRAERLLRRVTVEADERADDEPQAAANLRSGGDVGGLAGPAGAQHPFQSVEIVSSELPVAAQPLQRDVASCSRRHAPLGQEPLGVGAWGRSGRRSLATAAASSSAKSVICSDDLERVAMPPGPRAPQRRSTFD